MQRSWILALWRQNRFLPMLLLGLILINLGLLLLQRQWLEPRTEELRLTLDRMQRGGVQEGVGGPQGSSLARGVTDLERFHGLIPPKEGLSDFIGDLFLRAGQAGLELRQIAYVPETRPTTPGLLRYDVTFSLNGSYGQLKKFIYLLEEAPRIIVIEQVSLAGRERQSMDAKTVTLQLRLTTWFREDTG